MVQYAFCTHCGLDKFPLDFQGRCKDCAPAQEEKEMQFECRCKKCDCGFMSDRNNSRLCGTCGTTRSAELRQLHRDAALAALSQSNGNAAQNVAFAIAIADEFIRQYSPDAVIAEVVG